MADKQSFLEKLKAALIVRGISEQDIEPYIQQFDRFYDRMVRDENNISTLLGDVDRIADNIAAQVSDKYDEINRFAERTMTVQTVSVNTEVIDAAEVEFIDSDVGTGGMGAVEGECSDEQPDESGDVQTEEPSDKEQTDTDKPEGGTRLPDYVEKEKIPHSKKFWAIFTATLPLTLPLAAVVLSLFVSVWVVLIVLIVAAIGTLIAVSAVGAAASLIGIIYGIIQLFVSVPVGLYEIGIGIVIAGIVMFVGILLYNFAIRLMPFLIKRVYKLFKFTLSKLKARINRFRKECAES